MNTKYYDVIVAGAGPAGICAAVAAARQGARVALIERYGVIGGNLTAGYVGPILGSVSKNTMRDEVCAILGVKDNDWIGEHGNAHDFEEAKLTLAEFVAKEKNIDVEVILLNRDKRVLNEEFPYKIHSCDIIAKETASCVRKIYDYFRYSRFVRRILKQSDYSQIVVFTIANAVFLSYYLLSYYKKKYIFDIRDYSPLVKYTVPIIRRLLNNSALNCFSSPGFRSWLPACDYVICHNARRKFLDEDIVNARDIDVENVKVLTIGQLRNFITNKMLMDHLGNKSRITIQFSGMGIAYDLLKKYEVKKMYNNVKFTGYYPKKEEFSIVDGCDFMNIILPDDTLSRYLISNRFYLSLLRRKPMIVSSGGIQAEYVKEYDLGIIISSEDDIYSKIMIYARSFDPIQFQKNCDRFLEMVRSDMQIFSRSVFYSLNL